MQIVGRSLNRRLNFWMMKRSSGFSSRLNRLTWGYVLSMHLESNSRKSLACLSLITKTVSSTLFECVGSDSAIKQMMDSRTNTALQGLLSWFPHVLVSETIVMVRKSSHIYIGLYLQAVCWLIFNRAQSILTEENANLFTDRECEPLHRV